MASFRGTGDGDGEVGFPAEEFGSGEYGGGLRLHFFLLLNLFHAFSEIHLDISPES